MAHTPPCALSVARDAAVWATSGRRLPLAISVRLLTGPADAPRVAVLLGAAGPCAPSANCSVGRTEDSAVPVAGWAAAATEGAAARAARTSHGGKWAAAMA